MISYGAPSDPSSYHMDNVFLINILIILDYVLIISSINWIMSWSISYCWISSWSNLCVCCCCFISVFLSFCVSVFLCFCWICWSNIFMDGHYIIIVVVSTCHHHPSSSWMIMLLLLLLLCCCCCCCNSQLELNQQLVDNHCSTVELCEFMLTWLLTRLHSKSLQSLKNFYCKSTKASTYAKQWSIQSHTDNIAWYANALKV